MTALLLAAPAALLGDAPAAAASRQGFAQDRVTAIPAAPGTITMLRPVPPKAGARRCIDVTKVAGAILYGDRAAELTLRNGTRWRLYLAQSCPALSFYQGFYYRRGESGKLCAGRDTVIARSGGECIIASIMPVGRVHK